MAVVVLDGAQIGQHQRSAVAGTGIESPTGVHPYPPPKTHTSDKPERDSGGNFGRVARVHGLMQDYIAQALDTSISGIAAKHWIDFFRVFTDASDAEAVDAGMERLLRAAGAKDTERAEEIIAHLRAVQQALNGDPRPDNP